MNLLPFENFCIISPLTPEIVKTQLEKQIERPVYGFKGMSSRLSGASFIGKIANGKFKVIPKISGRNSFLPEIKGSIVPYSGGSLIYIKSKLHPISIIAISAFCIGITYAAIHDLYTNISRKQFNALNLIPFGMILFLVVLAIIEFKRQSRKAKNKLFEITDGELFTEQPEGIQ